MTMSSHSVLSAGICVSKEIQEFVALAVLPMATENSDHIMQRCRVFSACAERAEWWPSG